MTTIENKEPPFKEGQDVEAPVVESILSKEGQDIEAPVVETKAGNLEPGTSVDATGIIRKPNSARIECFQAGAAIRDVEAPVVDSIPSQAGVSFSEDAKAGDDGSVTELEPKKQSSDWSLNRNKSIKAIMACKKEETRFPLPEDIYAFLIVAPILSQPFLFSLYVFSLKIAVFVILATGIKYSDNSSESWGALVAKFLLIPVVVAMQEDLIATFWFIANVCYCPSMLQKSEAATKHKLYFSYALRSFDGLLSLYVNFAVMLVTSDVLSIFLNFAALQFLFSIDDIFYELVSKGFFGDKMEHMSVLCTEITLQRRCGADNTWIACFRHTQLDTIFYVFVVVVCLSAYFFTSAYLYTIE